jgi:hypothetical protein
MTDCTPVRLGSSRVFRGLAAGLIALSLSWIVSAPAAWADGDPASDVLATQSFFLPQDAGFSPAQQAQLGQLVQEMARSGIQIRLALIASPSDLGSITELWRQPAAYANFLGQELSLTYHGVLLVIMPDGFGLYQQGHALTQQREALAGVSIQPSGAGLATTTEQALQHLAAASGHSLALPRAQSPGPSGSSNAIPWTVFALGLVVTGIAWVASLRARPIGSGRRDAPAS